MQSRRMRWVGHVAHVGDGRMGLWMGGEGRCIQGLGRET